MQRKNNRNMDLEYSTWESLYNSSVLDSLQRRQMLYFDLRYSTTNNELRSNVPLPNKLKTNIKCRESWQATMQMNNSRNMDLEYSSCCCEKGTKKILSPRRESTEDFPFSGRKRETQDTWTTIVYPSRAWHNEKSEPKSESNQ